MLSTSSEFAARAANDALPMRDAFAVLFFVAVGMLFDPRSLRQVPMVIAVVLFVVIVVKPMAALPFPSPPVWGRGKGEGAKWQAIRCFRVSLRAAAAPLCPAGRSYDGA